MVGRLSYLSPLNRYIGQVTDKLKLQPDQSPQDDFALVDSCRKGHEKAFEQLLRKYQKLVLNVVYQMTRNHEQARDLTQETFLRAYRSLNSFKRGSSFRPWLLTIARNATLNHIRRERGKDSLDEIMEDNSALEPVSPLNVEDDVEMRLTQQDLFAALELLPLKQREVFVLRYQHDLTYDEIGEITALSLSSVKSLLFRARENLRKSLCDTSLR